MNPSFLLFELLRVFSALANLEPQVSVVVEQFGAQNISLLRGRVVLQIMENSGSLHGNIL